MIERTGQVITILGNYNFIYDSEHPINYIEHYAAAEHNDAPPSCIPAKAKGKLKLARNGSRSLVSVGDIVKYQMPEGIPSTENPAYISEILVRDSQLCRVTPKFPDNPDIVISNCDRLYLVVSAALAPPLKMIDKTSVACLLGGIDFKIVFNKLDIAEHNEIDFLIKTYKASKIPIYAISAIAGTGIDQLKEDMIGKTTGLFGLSGVGKSTMINRMLGSNIRIGAVDDYLQGRHTTSHSRMIPIPEGGWVVDTPGVKEFEIYGVLPDDLDSYFTEIYLHAENCKYNNCQHVNEPRCAVKSAVANGDIPTSRYESYLEILEQLVNIPLHLRGSKV